MTRTQPINISTTAEDANRFEGLRRPGLRRPSPRNVRALVVNAALPGENVVFSFNDATGHRDAIALTPAEALDFAKALVVTACVVAGPGK